MMPHSTAECGPHGDRPALSWAPRLRSALFDIASHDPEVAPRWILRIICSFFAVLIVWAALAKLDIVAVAEGRLVPQTYVKIVQPADAGVVREILVREGDVVAEGQVLLRLDPTENAADSVATDRETAIQRLEIRRIDAELGATEMVRQADDEPILFLQMQAQQRAHRQAYLDAVALEEQAQERTRRELEAAMETEHKLRTTLPSYERSAAAYEKLASQKLIGQLQAEAQRRTAVEQAQDLAAQRATVRSLESAVAQSVRRVAQLKSGYESDLHGARLAALEKLTSLDQTSTKLRYRQSHLELRAPQAGTVKELATTTQGAVVQPGTVLVSLVPANEPLRAEVLIRNQDIGFVRAGQPVRLKLATYPFQRYGMLEGTVKTIIADASESSPARASAGSGVSAADGPPASFKAVIELKEQALTTHGTRYPLAAGMQLAAEIAEGKRTVLEYLLSPVRQVTDEAGRER